MDPVVAILILVMVTATVATVFSLVHKRGQGVVQALLGIVLGWVLFLSPLYFFGPVGGAMGLVCIMLIGALMSFVGRRYDRGPARR
jgi:low temperature requirement protein LtrA